MRLLIIIPAYNEAASIEKVIDNLTENFPQYDYVIVDDGSTDETAAICDRRGYEVIHLPINLGIGGAVQTGYKYALENGYDCAVQMDGDGQHDPQFLEGMLKSLEEENVNEVVGSRFVEKKGFQSSGMRRFGINFLSGLGKFLTGTRLRDITSGYRLVDKRLLEIYASDYPSDYPEPEAMVIAAIYGCKILEYPVIMKERIGGDSSINPRRAVYYMIKVSIAMIIRRLSLGFRR